ncbi:MAG: glycine cleavage system aminomethyltransferase GcvT [Phycisphaerae bacterium]|nr:glycine cleavage system aminomethyltransferase GcvT [Phycisphaerae bacterium]
MSQLHRTVLYDRHVAGGGKIVDFAGWEMPMQYAGGIVAEHLATRKRAGIFDVSHMGRFVFGGRGAPAFLQHVLTNNAEALDVGQAQYTMIPNSHGGAVDDAYLYRFVEGEYLLVVNAANRQKDWDHFSEHLARFDNVEMTDKSEALAMISLQGPRSGEILGGIIDSGSLPEPMRNELAVVTVNGVEAWIARTGYTGEPVCFELFIESKAAPAIWDLLIDRGAEPVGLGARDTLRLEATLPLYGHELGQGPDGQEIPIFSCPLARFAVSFSPLKGDFIGKDALSKQHDAYKKILSEDYSLIADLPGRIVPVAVTGRGIARPPAKVFVADKCVGLVTSGTMVPYWQIAGEGLSGIVSDEQAMRSVCLAMLDSNLREGDSVQVEVRGKKTESIIVPYHLRSEAPPYARPILQDHAVPVHEAIAARRDGPVKARDLLEKTLENTVWRQRECINLIPSEQTLSPMARLISVMDPAFRYAEHKPLKAFYDADVFYYQGTDFIEAVETLLEDELRQFLGCAEVETRAVSGQMANAIVFSAMADYLNRSDRKVQPRRIGCVMNNHIIRGGHLSSQPMGALRDFIAHDPRTERPAAVNFPVLAENPYKIDVSACRELLERYRPELIIFGKSVVLHPEPVREIRSFVESLGIDTVIMYDMAHVLGLVGPHFQEPFADGADIVTGSTHKTFFGTQRGIVASNYAEAEERWHLWEAVSRRTFPGSVSNHHLGTLTGLLMAAYEMNHFRDEYQQKVLANAKTLAGALKRCGMDVAGDADIGYTQTHQVVVNVGYSRGPETARRLERNNIIVNYQAAPNEEGFTAAGALRLGVAEMTRFGMTEGDFETVAQFIADVVINDLPVKAEVKAFRGRFTDLRFCFAGEEFDDVMQKLHALI